MCNFVVHELATRAARFSPSDEKACKSTAFFLIDQIFLQKNQKKVHFVLFTCHLSPFNFQLSPFFARG